MITGEIKNKIDSIWDDFFSAGMSEYLTVIEQFSYLMFIHSLDEVENETEQYEKMSGEKKEHIFPTDKQKYRWHVFKTFEETELFNLMNKEIFPFIEKNIGKIIVKKKTKREIFTRKLDGFFLNKYLDI